MKLLKQLLIPLLTSIQIGAFTSPAFAADICRTKIDLGKVVPTEDGRSVEAKNVNGVSAKSLSWEIAEMGEYTALPSTPYSFELIRSVGKNAYSLQARNKSEKDDVNSIAIASPKNVSYALYYVVQAEKDNIPNVAKTRCNGELSDVQDLRKMDSCVLIIDGQSYKSDDVQASAINKDGSNSTLRFLVGKNPNMNGGLRIGLYLDPNGSKFPAGHALYGVSIDPRGSFSADIKLAPLKNSISLSCTR